MSDNKDKVIMTLVGVDSNAFDSNAFAILYAFRKNARQQGWTKEEISAVEDEAKSSDYKHLLNTIIDNIEKDFEDDDDLDD